MTPQFSRQIMWAVFIVWFVFMIWLAVTAAFAHEIYTGLHDKRGQLCCGGNDCAVTVYRETGGKFEFLTKEKHWVPVPQELITWLPVPGDNRANPDYHESPNGDELHRAHMCYRAVGQYDGSGSSASNVMRGDGQDIYLYCAFIAPGGM